MLQRPKAPFLLWTGIATILVVGCDGPTSPKTDSPTGTDIDQTPRPTPDTARVSITLGSSVPDCQTTDDCYDPSSVTMRAGGTVTWNNDDTENHTVTSGTPAAGPDGAFSSSLLASGAPFDHTFDTEGTFPYYCLVHPWMVGVVVVNPAESSPSSTITAARIVSARAASSSTHTPTVQVDADSPKPKKRWGHNVAYKVEEARFEKKEAPSCTQTRSTRRSPSLYRSSSSCSPWGGATRATRA